jgi:hypothetical protein
MVGCWAWEISCNLWFTPWEVSISLVGDVHLFPRHTEKHRCNRFPVWTNNISAKTGHGSSAGITLLSSVHLCLMLSKLFATTEAPVC